MQKITDASSGRADPAVQHSRAHKTVSKIAAAFGPGYSVALILADRSAYYTELRSAGFACLIPTCFCMAGGVLFAVAAGLFTCCRFFTGRLPPARALG
jgi:purine-cytosine permease-like protein